MSLKTSIMAAAAMSLIAGGLALAAAPANATTGTCLGEQFPTSGPVSCGGLFLPGMNPAGGTQPNSGTLTLTTPSSNYWNAPLSFDLYNPSDQKQDFTVYERCIAAPSTQAVVPSDAYPCGSATTTNPGSNTVYNKASNLPEFVTEVTPLGQHLGSGLNSPSNLCISWEALPVGPKGKYRFVMVERTCNSLGATFYPAKDDGGASPSGTGISGTVTSPNPYQTFTAIPGNGGDVIVNEALSHNFHNDFYAVDDQALGYPSGRALLYLENDGKNQIAKFNGCNGAVITTGVEYACA